MKSENLQLNIGDELGFVQLKNNIDSVDEVIFFPIVEITLKDGETAYRYMYPDGNISASYVRQSELKHRIIRINSDIEITIESENEPDMLCITDRKAEFIEALNRAEKSDLEVFADWEKDSFVVKNYTNDNEYRVNLDSANGKLFAECECKDYEFRKRICKHISAVLTDAMFGLSVNK